MKLANLHRLRGLTAAAVAFSHVAHWGGPTFAAAHVKPRLLAVGDLAVLVFFMISGFLMVHVHRGDFGRPAALRGYAIRRAFRIYPAYWFFLAVSSVLLCCTSWPRWGAFPRQPGVADIAGAVTLLPFSSRLTSFVPTDWTLYHEVCFYAVVAAAIVDRRLGGLVAATWLGASAVAAGRLGFSVAKVNVFFLVGGVLAVALPRLAAIPPRLARAVVAAAAVGIAAMLMTQAVPVARPVERAVAVALGVMLFAGVIALDAASRGAVVRKAVRPAAERPLADVAGGLLDRLGDVSYSVYLGHPLVQGGLRWICGAPDGVAGLLLFGLAPAVVLYPAWRWIEAPAIALGRRLCHNSPPRHAAAPPPRPAI